LLSASLGVAILAEKRKSNKYKEFNENILAIDNPGFIDALVSSKWRNT
jgi:hypothetical protein